MVARRNLRISSSLFPENIGPQIASIQPQLKPIPCNHFLYHLFSRRDIQPELLDHAEPDVARANLADLVRINTRFGGHSIIRKLFRDAGAGGAFSVLDVGAASGDTARVIQETYPHASVTSLDYSRINMGSAPYPKVLANAFTLPFADGAFDYVISSLFLHHFTDERVADLLRGFDRVARRAVLIADLERHAVPYLFLKCSRALFGWGFITVHDGLLSVRAAFRAPELLAVARRAGLENARVRTNRPAFRLTLVAEKK